MGRNTLRGSYFVTETKLCFRKKVGSNIQQVFVFINKYTGESRMGGATSLELQDSILEIVSSKETAPSTGWYGDPELY
jgi:hypothetical protein